MIGAVIVGAAIMLLVNGAYPSIFANVAGTMQETVGAPTNDNLVETNQFSEGWINSQSGEYVASPYHGKNQTTSFIPVDEYDHITVSLHDTIEDMDPALKGSGWFYDENKEPLAPGITLTQWEEPTSESVAVPDRAVYYRHNLLYGDQHRYKIEEGKEATEWRP